MSTRSRIGIKMPDGKIKSIYCHWDGYPSGVGKILKEHYGNPKDIEKLLDLGDISSLGTFYDEEISKADWNKFEMPPEKTAELITKAENCTVAYKDRGEKSSARIDDDFNNFMSKLGSCGEEYTYLFEEDYDGVYRWQVCETPYFRALEDKDCYGD